jgi:hypothetical protein
VTAGGGGRRAQNPTPQGSINFAKPTVVPA